ncbi:MAG: molybdopterin-dependent oxidoreductase [Betaproteobacteria bacterium]|nr:molybdopterin-dependent oxidoreductase [Betaproteobacteria bacterium]
MPNPYRRIALDGEAVVKEALRRLDQPARRAFLRRSLTLGGLSLLTGCAIVDEESVERALMKVSRLNDKVQAWLFDPTLLAPTYPESMITRPFPFNAYYKVDEVPEVDASEFRLEVGGLVADRHFGTFLRRVGADLSARYVGFQCADDYSTSIDMPTALHPQTLLALSFDGEPLPPRYGFPMKLRMPTKLGYKNPKHIEAIFVTNTYPGGYWEDQGYNWFGGS